MEFDLTQELAEAMLELAERKPNLKSIGNNTIQQLRENGFIDLASTGTVSLTKLGEELVKALKRQFPSADALRKHFAE